MFSSVDEAFTCLRGDIEKAKISRKEATAVIDELKARGVLSSKPFKKANKPWSYLDVIDLKSRLVKDKDSVEGWYHYIEVAYSVRDKKIKKSVIRISTLIISAAAVIGLICFIISKLNK